MTDPHKMFSPILRRKLLRLRESEWRRLRAAVRWCYMRWDLDPPAPLRSYIIMLPNDSQIWRTYAREIAKERKKISAAKRRKQKRAAQARERDRRRDYQRDYMKEYRARQSKPNTVKR